MGPSDGEHQHQLVEGEVEAGMLSTRLMDLFPALYLTLTSIIQGVAFTYLVITVNGQTAHPTLTVWVQAAASLLLLMVVWGSYALVALALAWFPTILDSVIPFLLSSGEVFVVQSIGLNPTRWLLALALTAFAGDLAFLNLVWRATKLARNRPALQALNPPLVVTVTSIGGLLSILLWALYGSGIVPGSSVLGPTLLLLSVLSFGAATALGWSQLERLSHPLES